MSDVRGGNAGESRVFGNASNTQIPTHNLANLRIGAEAPRARPLRFVSPSGDNTRGGGRAVNCSRLYTCRPCGYGGSNPPLPTNLRVGAARVKVKGWRMRPGKGGGEGNL